MGRDVATDCDQPREKQNYTLIRNVRYLYFDSNEIAQNGRETNIFVD